ncbi:imelysin family protein [Rhizobium sp. YIM 134829]|uniref:imelysin family protein n=1 Tax=Rhizobium sp. YIM 134829 TaxID=3390453 RepID=UPI00397A4A15
MRLSFLLPLAVALSLASVAGAQEADDDASTPAAGQGLVTAAVPAAMAGAVDGFIRPGYRIFAEKADIMAELAPRICAAPSAEGIEAFRSAFRDTALAWARIEIVRVGPVLEANRFERILFFPDRKSLGLKQVQRLIAEKDETATAVETLTGKSVAVQGLGALDYILNGTEAETLTAEPHSFRCRYGAAIAANLAGLGRELVAAWDVPDGVATAWKTPGPGNPLYRTEREAATELLGVLVHGLETMRDQRLRPFFAGTVDGKPDPGRPRLAVYWRSGLTIASIRANVDGLQSLFDAARMQSLVPPEDAPVATAIRAVMAELSAAAAAVDRPVDETLATAEGRAALLLVSRHANDLLQRLNLDLGAAMGLGAGFSFGDGD